MFLYSGRAMVVYPCKHTSGVAKRQISKCDVLKSASDCDIFDGFVLKTEFNYQCCRHNHTSKTAKTTTVNFGRRLAQSHPYFFPEFVSVTGLGKPNMYTKFEVTSFSCCGNNDGNPQISESSISESHAHFTECAFMMALDKSKLHIKCEVYFRPLQK